MERTKERIRTARGGTAEPEARAQLLVAKEQVQKLQRGGGGAVPSSEHIASIRHVRGWSWETFTAT